MKNLFSRKIQISFSKYPDSVQFQFIFTFNVKFPVQVGTPMGVQQQIAIRLIYAKPIMI